MASSRITSRRGERPANGSLAGEVVLVETFRGPRLCAPATARLIRQLAKARRRPVSRVH
jgi:hypothetical protein